MIHTPHLTKTQNTESDDAWRTGQVSNALTVLRRGGEGSSPAAHRLALQTLGSYITHLGPEDAVQMVRQALELGGLGQLAFAALEELRRMKGKEARRVLLREADALVSAACKAGRIQMAVRVVEEVQLELVRPSSKRRQRQRQRREEGEGPSLALGVGQEEEEAKEGKGKASFISRGAYLSLLRRLQQKGRPRSHCRLAESLLTHKGRPAAAALAGDAEATGLAAVVCWKAKRWRAVQRLLRVWEADGFCPLSQEEGPGPGRDDGAGAAADDGATLRRMEALFAALQREQQLEQGQRQVLTTEHGNMLLHARLRAGQRDAAAALAERMLQAGAAQSSSLLLPPANALSVCLVLEALGRAGDWDMCLQLLQGAKDRLQAMDKAGLAMVYKTAIGAFCFYTFDSWLTPPSSSSN